MKETEVKQKETAIRERVAAAVGEIQKANGLSLSVMSEKISVQKGALSKYLNRQAVPRLSALLSVASYFSVSLDYMIVPGYNPIKQVETLKLRRARVLLKNRFHELFGQFLAAARISQKEISERIGISENAVSKYVTGKSYPDIDVLAKIAVELQIGVHELVTGVIFSDEIEGTVSDLVVNLMTDAECDAILDRAHGNGENVPSEASLPSIKPSAFAAMSRTPEDLAEDVEATADQVRAWMAGSAQPSHRQLVLLFNELAKAATALARCDHGAQRPESVPPQPAQAVA